MNAKQRNKNRRTAEWLYHQNPPTKRCRNCDVLDYYGHFAPPSFGEPGFFTCEPPEVGTLGIKVHVDPNMPAGRMDVLQDGKLAGRIENIGEPTA